MTSKPSFIRLLAIVTFGRMTPIVANIHSLRIDFHMITGIVKVAGHKIFIIFSIFIIFDFYVITVTLKGHNKLQNLGSKCTSCDLILILLVFQDTFCMMLLCSEIFS